jgi:hypothetical protein
MHLEFGQVICLLLVGAIALTLVIAAINDRKSKD